MKIEDTYVFSITLKEDSIKGIFFLNFDLVSVLANDIPQPIAIDKD